MVEKSTLETAQSKGGLDLAHSTAHWIKVAHKSFQQLLQARLEPHGIKLSHWYCLRYLWEEDGLTQRELSKRVHVKETTIVAVINEMESLGLIKRVRNPDDRRKYIVSLTAQAKRVTSTLLPVARTVNQLGTRDFTNQEIDLHRALTQRVAANLNHALVEDSE